MTRRGQPGGCPRTWYEAMLLAIWILLVGSAPVEGQAAQYRVAVLTPRPAFHQVLAGLQEGLVQLDYQEGKNLALMVEDARGEAASLPDRAVRLIETKPDVIVAITTAPALAAKQATTTIPIVFALIAEPAQLGLVASYASSQNNVTGISSHAGPLSGKRLEILQEIAPGIQRVLVLVAPHEDVAELSFRFLVDVAPKLGIQLLRRDVRSKEEIAQTLQAVPRGAVDAMYHVPSSLVGTHIELLIRKAKEDKIPLAVAEHPMVEQGALVSYGANMRLLGLQAAKLVAKILKGAKPSEIPVQTPEQFPLAINLSTARAIGLDIPASILERVEHIVE